MTTSAIQRYGYCFCLPQPCQFKSIFPSTPRRPPRRPPDYVHNERSSQLSVSTVTTGKEAHYNERKTLITTGDVMILYTAQPEAMLPRIHMPRVCRPDTIHSINPSLRNFQLKKLKIIDITLLAVSAFWDGIALMLPF